jgi:hypothetical protein
MPKKIFAVTNVKVGNGADEYWPAGSVIEPGGKLSKEQLLELHESGAIEVRVVDEEVAPDGEPVNAVVSNPTGDPTKPPVEDSQTIQTTPPATPVTPAKDTDAKNK